MDLQHGQQQFTHRNDQPFCIEVLIGRLRSLNGAERLNARTALIGIGRPSVPYILPLLTDASEQVRWEACKTLEYVRDPAAASSLAKRLLDGDMDVRWVAADALIELERHAVVPLLLLIEEEFDSPVLREAAHHVLHALKERRLLCHTEIAVLNALKVNELPSKAAFCAHHAMDDGDIRSSRIQ